MGIATKPLSGARLTPLHPLNRGRKITYLLNEKSGTRINDIAGGKGGLINGASWAGSPTGGGLSFNGSTSFANIGKSHQEVIDYNKPFSASVWFVLNSSYATNGYYGLLGFHKLSGSQWVRFDMAVGIADRIQSYFLRSPSTNVADGYLWHSGDLNFVPGKLYNYTFVYDGLNASTSGKIYVNGIPISVTVGSNAGAITTSYYSGGSVNVGDLDLFMGAVSNTGSADNFFPGVIDQLDVWNRILLPSEVAALYNNQFIGIKRQGKAIYIPAPPTDYALDPMGRMGIMGI